MSTSTSFEFSQRARQPNDRAVIPRFDWPCALAIGWAHHSVLFSCPHAQWLLCQLGVVDANHFRMEAYQQAKSQAVEMGQMTVITRPPLRNATLISLHRLSLFRENPRRYEWGHTGASHVRSSGVSAIALSVCLPGLRRLFDPAVQHLSVHAIVPLHCKRL